MANEPMPAYVEYGSRVSAPPPVECKGGSFLALVVEGEAAKIAALVDRVLNAPAHGKVEYRPLFAHMLLLVGSFAQISSGAKGFTGWGSVAETHLSLWVPVAAGSSADGEFAPARLALAVPYIFVDNPLSYAGGREDYGYPKAMGQFTPPGGAGEKVELNVFGGNFGRGNHADWTPLLTVASQGAGEEDVTGWRPEGDLVPYLRDLTTPDSIGPFGFSISKLVAAILSGAVGQVALKQVRAASAEDVACYQAIIEAPVKIENLTWRAAAGPWQLELQELESHPIGEDLGLGGTVAAEFALDLGFDLILKPGEPVAP